MEDTQIEQQIQAKGLTAPRVTPARIDELMDQTRYVTEIPEGSTSTFCHVYLAGKNGAHFYLTSGHSACVSPENFDVGIGADIAESKATQQAREKLWELEGYALFKELNYAG